jgi:hypothetical protein
MADTTPLSLQELAESLRLPATWLDGRARDGLLPHFRKGRTCYFSLDAVRKALLELSAIRSDTCQCEGYPLFNAAHTARCSIFDRATLVFLAKHRAIPHFVGSGNRPVFDPDSLGAWITGKITQLGVNPASATFRDDLARALYLRANPKGLDWELSRPMPRSPKRSSKKDNGPVCAEPSSNSFPSAPCPKKDDAENTPPEECE